MSREVKNRDAPPATKADSAQFSSFAWLRTESAVWYGMVNLIRLLSRLSADLR